MAAAVLALRGLRKTFGSNQVLRGIDLDLRPGEVTVLMGANGAGKSTLVKIVGGVYRPDAGAMTLTGQPFAPDTPAEAIRAGIVTVHQSINDGVIPDLDVATNLMLDRLAGGSEPFLFSRRRARRVAAEIAAGMGLHLDLDATVRDLSLADRQLVAIARAMAHEPQVMILDEPTSSLSATEARRLFALVDRLAERGVAILYISHRMSDIRRIADRIVTMRDGAISGLFETKPLDTEGAVNAMLGRVVGEVTNESPPPGAPVLTLEGLVLRPGARPIDFAFRRNEVVAITGLVGVGKSEFAAALFGLHTPIAGSMTLEGRAYRPSSARAAIEAGVFMTPKDRTTNALVADFDIAGNITLPFLSRFSALSVMRRGAVAAKAREEIRSLGIVCQGERDPIGTLSGGNQQKVVVARWLSQPSRVLVLDEPFQGVDIAARRDIGRKLRETASDRATIVLVAELDEALEVADRIVVMAEHSFVGEHAASDADVDLILSQVAGGGVGEDTKKMAV